MRRAPLTSESANPRQPAPSARAEFEAWLLDRFGSHTNLARSPDGYIGTVSHPSLRMTYASIQMLWEAWVNSRYVERVAALIAKDAASAATRAPAQCPPPSPGSTG